MVRLGKSKKQEIKRKQKDTNKIERQVVFMFGLIIGLGIKLGANIAYEISNMKCKSTPCGNLDNGDPYYMDRAGKMYAANGEKMILKRAVDARGDSYYRTVGERTGKVYFDKEKTFQDQADRENEESRQRAIREGRLAYGYRDRSLKFPLQQKVTKEISTGKYIARIEYIQHKKEFRKYYLKPNAYFPFDVADGDKGVLITKEEFENLNFYDGGHKVYFWEEFYRDRNNKLI